MSVSIGPNVYALYVLKTGARGALNLQGTKDELEAIDYLIRSYLGRVVYAVKDAVPIDQAKTRIESVVRSAVTHCDEDDDERSEQQDCDTCSGLGVTRDGEHGDDKLCSTCGGSGVSP